MSSVIRRGKATRGDLALWDGINSSVTRLDASGGTVTGLPVGVEVDVLQVYGSGTERTRGTVASALNAIGSAAVTLMFSPGTWTIDSSLTIPSNFTCHIARGAVFSVSSGQTLAFSGPVIADSSTFYSGAGTTVLSVDSLVGGAPWIARTAAEVAAGVTPAAHAYTATPIDVLRYGLVPNSTAARTANTAALQALLDPTTTGPKGRLIFPPITGADTYYFNDMIPIRDGIHIDLCGCTLDFSKTYASADDHRGFLYAIRDFSIENGAIIVDYDGSAGVHAGPAIKLGQRDNNGTDFQFGDEDTLTFPMGRFLIRNLRITTNNPVNDGAILMLGGPRDVVCENVVISGGDACSYGILAEFGTYDSAPDPDLTAHASNLIFRNIRVGALDDSTFGEGAGIALIGAYSALVENLHVDTAHSVLEFRPGEALNYNPGPYDEVGAKRCITIRNVVGQNIASNGINLVGSEAASGGYLAATIAALAAGPEAAAQNNLYQFSLDGFALSCSGAGIVVSGPCDIRNGTAIGCTSGVRILGACLHFNLANLRVLDSTSIGVRITEQATLPPTSAKRLGKITNCVVAGSNGAGIAIDYCEAVLIEACQLGYNTEFTDAANEATQTAGVSVLSEGNGVVCTGNYCTTSGGALAYTSAGTGDRGNAIYNARGTYTFSASLWCIDGIARANATDIADKTHAINTKNKYVGKQVYDQSNTRLMIAQGSTDVSAWIRADGASTVTPA